MVISIGKNNCTCSEERNGEQLHFDTSALCPAEKQTQTKDQELDELDEEIENKKMDDTSIYIAPAALVQNLRLIKKLPSFNPDVLPDVHNVHG